MPVTRTQLEQFSDDVTEFHHFITGDEDASVSVNGITIPSLRKIISTIFDPIVYPDTSALNSALASLGKGQFVFDSSNSNLSMVYDNSGANSLVVIFSQENLISAFQNQAEENSSNGDAAKIFVNFILDSSVSVSGVYSDMSVGVESVELLEYYAVPQKNGSGCYIFQKVEGGSNYIEVAYFNAQDFLSQENILREQLADAPENLAGFWTSVASRKYDGRVLINLLGDVPPTLNTIPRAWGAFNDQTGSTSPDVVLFDGNVTDALGNQQSSLLTFDNANDVFAVADAGVYSDGNLRIVASLKSNTGDTDYRIGGGTVNSGEIDITGAWAEYVHEFDYVSTNGTIGIRGSNTSAGQSGSVNLGRLGVYDGFGGLTLPTAQEELTAQLALHAKPSGSKSGKLKFDDTIGLITTDQAGLKIPLTLHSYTPESFTIGVSIRCDSIDEGTGVIQNALAFAYTSNAELHATDAQIAVSSRNDQSGGRAYFTGESGASLKVSQTKMVGNGWHNLTYSQRNDGKTFATIDGVEIELGTEPALEPVKDLIVGAYNRVIDGDIHNNNFEGAIDFIYFSNGSLTSGEILRMNKISDQAILRAGAYINRNFFFVMGGDSISDGGEWTSILAGWDSLRPKFNGTIEAVGGTDLENWNAGTRFENIQSMLSQAASGFDNPVFLMHLGNEGTTGGINGWLNSDGTYSHTREFTLNGETTTWREQVSLFVQNLKRVHPSVRVVCMGIIANGSNGDLYSESSINYDIARRACMSDIKENLSYFGFDAVIDTGLGTEVLNGINESDLAPEIEPGGSRMGNYRQAAACRSYSRNLTSAVTLSATNGSSFTATSDPGTFSWQDVYRRLAVSDTESAEIIAVNADGSEATLSTDGFVPNQDSSETDAFIASHTIAYNGFMSLNYTSGLTVKNALGPFLTDGLHPHQSGAYMIAQFIAGPGIQRLMDGLITDSL